MYATLLADARFHDLLLAADRDLAEACRTEGCACGGRRHSAATPASRAAGRAVSGPSTTSASASAAPSTAAARGRRRRRCASSGARSMSRPSSCLIAILRDERQRRAARAPERGRVGRPAHDRPLAQVVARHVPGDAVLEGGARGLHAAARWDAASGGADRPLRRRSRRIGWSPCCAFSGPITGGARMRAF